MNEIQKKQTDYEIMVTELSLGRRVKAAPKRKWLKIQSRLRRMIENDNEYKTDKKKAGIFKIHSLQD